MRSKVNSSGGLNFGIGLALAIILLAAAACRPHAVPHGPGAEPARGKVTAPTRQVIAPSAREVVIGEMCPTAADGRPAVLPLFARGIGWSSDSEVLGGLVERRAARLFSVLGWDGRRVGVFSVAGVADVDANGKAAIGAYAGDSPCLGPANESGKRPPIPGCVEAQDNCGLALAFVDRSAGIDTAPFDEDPEPAAVPVAGACLAGDNLLVDIDDDGSAEAYPVEQFLDPVRAPAEEVLSVARGEASCQPTFAARSVLPATDPKHWRGLDVLGVIDLDGDGRRELVVSYHYETRRTWAIYSALKSVGRLDLVGEAVPWTRASTN